jgi:hypothetical protein
MQAQAAEYSGYAGPFRCFFVLLLVLETLASELPIRPQ